MTLVAKFLAITLLSLAGIWVMLAWNAGMFMQTQDRLAVAPGEWTDDGFSHQKKIMELPDYTIAYVEAGQGPPLILLHGCPFSVYEWNQVLPELAKDFHVFAPDLVGLGDTSVTLSEDYRLPHDVQMVLQMMDKLGLTSANFIAHDHGGATLQLMMKEAPDRIRKAVMTNVEAYDQWPSKPELPYLKAIVNPITSPLLYHALKFEAVQKDIFSIAVFDEASITTEIARGFSLPHIATPARWQRLRRFFAWQMDPEHNALPLTAVPAMRAFDRPVLLLWGMQDDNFGPELAQRLARDIPGVRGIHGLYKSEHMPMMEEAPEYARAAARFLLAGEVSPDALAAVQAARAPRAGEPVATRKTGAAGG